MLIVILVILVIVLTVHSSQSEASFRVPVQCCIVLVIFTSTQAFQIYTKALIINYEDTYGIEID